MARPGRRARAAGVSDHRISRACGRRRPEDGAGFARRRASRAIADSRQRLAAHPARVTPPLLFVSGEYPPDIGGVADYTERLRGGLGGLGWPTRVLSRRQVKHWDARALMWLARTAPRTGVVHIQYQAGAYDLLGDVCLMPALLRRIRPRVRVVTTFHDVRPPFLFP